MKTQELDWPLDTRKRWVANWLKRRGYVMTNRAASGGIEWWTRGDPNYGITVELSNDDMQYKAFYRLHATPDVHVTVYLRDLGTKETRDRFEVFERMHEKMQAHADEGWP